MVDAVRTEFGDRVSIDAPMGGTYVWLTFPDGTDTNSLTAAAGIEFTPGDGWSADPAWGQSRLRLCFGAHSEADIGVGVAQFAAIYHATIDA